MIYFDQKSKIYKITPEIVAIDTENTHFIKY